MRFHLFLYFISQLNSTSTASIRPPFTASTSIREYGSAPLSVTTESFPLKDFYRRYKNLNVYNYLGSLTTPGKLCATMFNSIVYNCLIFTGCNEAVIWCVSKDTIPISQAELDLLKQVKDDKGKPIMKNNRPVNPLNGRSLTRFF